MDQVRLNLVAWTECLDIARVVKALSLKFIQASCQNFSVVAPTEMMY